MLNDSFCFKIQRMDKKLSAEKEQKRKGKAEDGPSCSHYNVQLLRVIMQKRDTWVQINKEKTSYKSI